MKTINVVAAIIRRAEAGGKAEGRRWGWEMIKISIVQYALKDT